MAGRPGALFPSCARRLHRRSPAFLNPDLRRRNLLCRILKHGSVLPDHAAVAWQRRPEDSLTQRDGAPCRRLRTPGQTGPEYWARAPAWAAPLRHCGLGTGAGQGRHHCCRSPTHWARHPGTIRTPRSLRSRRSFRTRRCRWSSRHGDSCRRAHRSRPSPSWRSIIEVHVRVIGAQIGEVDQQQQEAVQEIGTESEIADIGIVHGKTAVAGKRAGSVGDQTVSGAAGVYIGEEWRDDRRRHRTGEAEGREGGQPRCKGDVAVVVDEHRRVVDAKVVHREADADRSGRTVITGRQGAGLQACDDEES